MLSGSAERAVCNGEDGFEVLLAYIPDPLEVLGLYRIYKVREV